MFQPASFRSSAEGLSLACLDTSSGHGQFNDLPGQANPNKSTLSEASSSEERDASLPVVPPASTSDASIPVAPPATADADARISSVKDTSPEASLDALRSYLPQTNWARPVRNSFESFANLATKTMSPTKSPEYIRQMTEALSVPKLMIAAASEREVVTHLQESLSQLQSALVVGADLQQAVSEIIIKLPKGQAQKVFSREPQEQTQDPSASRQRMDRAYEAIDQAWKEVIQALDASVAVEAGPKRESMRMLCAVVRYPIRQIQERLDVPIDLPEPFERR